MVKTVYECSYCGLNYAVRKEAEDCEASHPLCADIAVKALSKFSGKWPEQLQVSRGDDIATYKLFVERPKIEKGWLDDTATVVTEVPAYPNYPVAIVEEEPLEEIVP